MSRPIPHTRLTVRWDADHPLLLHRPRSPVVAMNAADAADRLAEIQQSLSRDEVVAGYLSYDFGRAFESLPSDAMDDLRLPLLMLARAEALHSPGDSPTFARPLLTPPPKEEESEALASNDGRAQGRSVRSTFSPADYLRAVRRCIDYIAAGDVFQINLSQRFTAAMARSPAAMFEHLLRHYPAQYAASLDFGDVHLISNSPELFLRVERLPDGRRRITNRPIKGTRPRLPGMEQQLRDSAKDKAELAMIVDLQRNDLGRVCEIGSVRVVEPRVIEAHPTVYHGVATIEGILREDAGLLDILRATFPCGSVTGCPKIRAMEIIDELEPVRRGPYCGAIGWIRGDGTMELSVAIRTMIVKDGQVHIPVGGGIVADSDPAMELDETIVKARAMFDAAGIDWPPRDVV